MGFNPLTGKCHIVTKAKALPNVKEPEKQLDSKEKTIVLSFEDDEEIEIYEEKDIPKGTTYANGDVSEEKIDDVGLLNFK